MKFSFKPLRKNHPVRKLVIKERNINTLKALMNEHKTKSAQILVVDRAGFTTAFCLRPDDAYEIPGGLRMAGKHIRCKMFTRPPERKL